MRLPYNRGEYLPVSSGWFAKYVSRTLGEVYDCFWGKQEKKVRL